MEASPISWKAAAPSKIPAKTRLSNAGVLHAAKVLEPLFLRRFCPKNRPKLNFAPIPPRARLRVTPHAGATNVHFSACVLPTGQFIGS